MAVGDLGISDWWRVMRREIISGFLLGLVLGIIGFFRILIWHSIASACMVNTGCLSVSQSVLHRCVVMWGSIAGQYAIH